MPDCSYFAVQWLNVRTPTSILLIGQKFNMSFWRSGYVLSKAWLAVILVSLLILFFSEWSNSVFIFMWFWLHNAFRASFRIFFLASLVIVWSSNICLEIWGWVSNHSWQKKRLCKLVWMEYYDFNVFTRILCRFTTKFPPLTYVFRWPTCKQGRYTWRLVDTPDGWHTVCHIISRVMKEKYWL